MSPVDGAPHSKSELGALIPKSISSSHVISSSGACYHHAWKFSVAVLDY